MERLRTTFKRSRTPTGAEMKTQSSLEVPKQVRSASFDEMQLEAKRIHQVQQHADGSGLLRVPQLTGQRSKSVDSGGSEESIGNYLEVPKRFQRRRSSGTRSPACVHCVCLEEFNRLQAQSSEETQPDVDSRSFSLSDNTSDEEEEEDQPLPPSTAAGSQEDEEADQPEAEKIAVVPECNITVTLSPTMHNELLPSVKLPSVELEPGEFSPPPVTLSRPFDDELLPSIECGSAEGGGAPPVRRRSIQRQEAFFAEPTGNSLENMSDATSEPVSDATSDGVHSEGDTTTMAHGLIVRDIYLAVPDLKRDRAASVDSCFSKLSPTAKTEELQHSGNSLEVPVGPNVTLRSRSVDIVLPTDEQARYKALAMTGAPPPNCKGKAVGTDATTDIKASGFTPDWTENAVDGEHLWVPTSVSGDFCYVADTECPKHGPRVKCSACHVVAHVTCLYGLREKLACKPTFRDVGVRQYREKTSVQHHWVHRRSEKGKCKQCSKSFQSKLSFCSKEIVALSCSWCKNAFHNKETCFNMQRIEEECNLGTHKSIIVPPSWIIKLPKKGSFKSSLNKSPNKKSSSKRKSREKDKEQPTFVIKPIPTANVTPLVVFINPKSGGNQGAKLMQKFQWWLNPRQVFDLIREKPRMALEMFRKVPNLRILACGGDGTVGWVLSVLDEIGVEPPPAVAVLPLGTGNDLARALGWGGGYTDEPVSKILSNISESETVQLDRWSLKVEKNTEVNSSKEGKDKLPLNVINNYFSMGVDAYIALEFHEAREAHPEIFNSRLKNKMFYGSMGGIDLVRRKWKSLAEFVTLECDGKDLTAKLKEHKVHGILFLNISSYGGGTNPWNRSCGMYEPRTDDGLIEVVGLTTYQLPLIQAGGHGTCITQCKTARIVTSKTIPMQVDGEACKVRPSIITLSHLNKATMLAKRKSGKAFAPQTALENINVNTHKITLKDYEQHHYDKDLLIKSARLLGSMDVNPACDLEVLRGRINKDFGSKLLSDWCFVDSCTAERFFRVDRAQEYLHYVADIATDSVFVLELGSGTRPPTPDDEAATASPGSAGKGSYVIPEMRVSSEDSLESPSDLSQATREDAKLKEMTNNTHHNYTKSQDPFSFSNHTDKTSEGVLKAAKLGDVKLLKELHGQGYSLLTTDQMGQTALHYAARFGHKDIIKYLIAYAPSSIMNIRDIKLGQTALHKAAAGKYRNICCMLVAGGASLSVTDHQGMTPRLLALQAEDPELAGYLESQENFQLVAEDLGTVV